MLMKYLCFYFHGHFRRIVGRSSGGTAQKKNTDVHILLSVRLGYNKQSYYLFKESVSVSLRRFV